MPFRLTRFKSYVATMLVSTELEHRPHTLASYLYFYQHKGKRWLELSPGFAGSCVLSSLPHFIDNKMCSRLSPVLATPAVGLGSNDLVRTLFT